MIQSSFIQGTTPTQIFELPCHTNLLRDLTITYTQRKKVIVKKRKSDCILEENIVTTKLTQKESLSFNPDFVVEVQLKFETETGDVLASPKYTMSVDEILDKEEF